jgi:hypothetical protein
MTTNVVITESSSLTRTKAPSLPIAPTVYSRQYGDQLNNVLRLYFSQLDNFVGQFALGSVYLVADLPPTAATSVGARAFVTNSSVTTFNTIVAGGGTSKVPVFFDGTNWRVG